MLALDMPFVLFIAKLLTPRSENDAGILNGNYQMPSQAKLVTALVLSLGDFNLSELIYKHVPLHRMFENESAMIVKRAYDAILNYILRNFRNILWSLLLSNDGLIPYQSIVT
jgi:hypothetical protein